MTDEQASLQDALDALTERFGPLEVALIMAPEPFEGGPGLRPAGEAWSVQIAVAGLKRESLSLPGTDLSAGQIGDLTLVLNEQSAGALHSFLEALLRPDSGRKRREPGGLLQIE